mmetsp:Transcript_51946/g.160796  ORF Transcript_51946/g.160796 Transcript_51946/m.160796 type:complete len:215 (+) Transcript_51946:79-723(+)
MRTELPRPAPCSTALGRIAQSRRGSARRAGTAGAAPPRLGRLRPAAGHALPHGHDFVFRPEHALIDLVAATQLKQTAGVVASKVDVVVHPEVLCGHRDNDLAVRAGLCDVHGRLDHVQRVNNPREAPAVRGDSLQQVAALLAVQQVAPRPRPRGEHRARVRRPLPAHGLLQQLKDRDGFRLLPGPRPHQLPQGCVGRVAGDLSVEVHGLKERRV